MPAGMPWGSYIKVVTASMISMLAGAAVVHNYYKPNLVIYELINNNNLYFTRFNFHSFRLVI
jgi:hypothetical protein